MSPVCQTPVKPLRLPFCSNSVFTSILSLRSEVNDFFEVGCIGEYHGLVIDTTPDFREFLIAPIGTYTGFPLFDLKR